MAYHKAKDGLPMYADFNSVINGDGQTLEDVIQGLKNMIIDLSSDGFDVVIIGSGSAGIAAAYALKDSSLSVCLVEKQNTIGGTAINAWMNAFAASGDVPFLKKVTEDLIQDGKAKYVNTGYQDLTSAQIAATVYDDTIVEQRFITNGRTERCVTYDVDALRSRYINDLSSVMIITSAELVSATSSNGVVSSITLSTPNGQRTIKGKVFIDATADDVLLRLIGNDTYIGSDAKTRYQSEYGFTEANGGNTSVATALNYPSLIYRIVPGEEDLSGVTAAYTNDALAYSNPDNSPIYINPVSYLAGNDCKGENVISDGVSVVYGKLATRTLQHWKTIKNGGSSRFTVWNFPTKKYESYAPMLGVRETYRAKCERMLNENNFYVQVSSANIATGDNLDKKIAYGNHIADSHGDSSINTQAINANLVPYGVPYGCIVPKGLTNVFVASRGAGMTHIGACSFRLNKDVMQLGYAAGKAALIFHEDDLSDTRDVDVEKLQSAQYTNFVGLVSRLEAYID